MLLRSHAGEPWTVTAMSKRLYINEPLCAEVLSRLEADGLCACREGFYSYALSDTPKHETVDRLADTYSRYLIPVTNVITASPPAFRNSQTRSGSGRENRMAATIYSLCALVALVCAYLLFTAYFRQHYRLLLWSGYCFAGLTLNNVLLVLDKIFLPQIDLSIWRLLVAQISLLILLSGLIWDAN